LTELGSTGRVRRGQTEERLEGVCRRGYAGPPAGPARNGQRTGSRPGWRTAPAGAADHRGNVELAYLDQGYTGEAAEQAAAEHGIQLEVVKHTEAKRGFVLPPRRWVVERSFAWAARFRRLARDYERLALTLGAFHFLTCACLMLATLSRNARLVKVNNTL
jgi:transposase